MSIYKKLHELKKEIGKVSKTSTNPFFKSKYFDINELLANVEPLVDKNNLVLLQPILDGFVITKIIDIESGEDVQSAIQLPNIQDPQKLGSAITYYRRYTLQSLLGLQAEDDDGNVASKQVNKPIATPKRLTPDQVAVISKADDANKLAIVLKTYTLQPDEKAAIEKRIKELKK